MHEEVVFDKTRKAAERLKSLKYVSANLIDNKKAQCWRSSGSSKR